MDERLLKGDKVTTIHRWAVKTFPAEMMGVDYHSLARHKRIHVGPFSVLRKSLVMLIKWFAARSNSLATCSKIVLIHKRFSARRSSPSTLLKLKNALDFRGRRRFRKPRTCVACKSVGRPTAIGRTEATGGSISDGRRSASERFIRELHQRLDPILSSVDSDRQSAARALLGLPSTPPKPCRASRSRAALS